VPWSVASGQPFSRKVAPEFGNHDDDGIAPSVRSDHPSEKPAERAAELADGYRRDSRCAAPLIDMGIRNRRPSTKSEVVTARVISAADGAAPTTRNARGDTAPRLAAVISSQSWRSIL